MEYRTLLKQYILDEDAFIRAVFSGSVKGAYLPWKKVVLRPVLIKNRRHLQFSYFDAAKDITKNYTDADAHSKLDELLALPFRSFHVETTGETLQVNINPQGKATVTRHRAARPQPAPVLDHDRRKQRILTVETAAPFLEAVGILNRNGTLKAGMQDKFVQINEFLKLLSQTGAFETFSPDDTVHVVDFGCGNAYLTFALYHYLTENLRLRVRLTGVDVRDDLLRRHREKAGQLGWDGLTFVEARISDYQPETPPAVVVALHACDTATDDAIALGIVWNSKLIVTAPCCQHHLQAQLCELPTPAPFGSVWRDGILSERLGDVLTDTFRAQLLRVMGYKTDVVQFVSDEHTPKNLMIRAVKTASKGNAKAREEYDRLKSYWGVTPYLETLLDAARYHALKVEVSHRRPAAS